MHKRINKTIPTIIFSEHGEGPIVNLRHEAIINRKIIKELLELDPQNSR